VVTIDVGRRWTATGTLWRDGVVVTTAHAIRDTDSLNVITSDGVSHPAAFGGWDLGTDLAVLKVDGLTTTVPLGTAAERDPLRVGELAVVLAGAGGNAPVARLTMIAGVGTVERWRRGARLADVIELDTTPVPGFSGGLLADTRGRIVGINSAGIVRRAALALPVGAVGKVLDELLIRGRVARGYLGVGMHPVRTGRTDPSAAAPGHGLLVHSLEPGGPADRAGVLVGDILVNIDGRPLDAPQRLIEALGGERVGEAVRLGVIRGGNSTEIPVVLGERPQRHARRGCHAR
jgi:S1-C subfamily serine protease